jgi:3-deoxy-manno-octulosonate cytidylyltransferase (CMP-KDO synthetase)
MFFHVYRRVIESGLFASATVATDDDRIFNAAKSLDVPAVMTRNDHESGTDRVLEAAKILNIPGDAVVVNVQGDEPALDPAVLAELLAPFDDPETRVATPASAVTKEEALSPDLVKVVFSKDKTALYFSRSLIPYDRDGVSPTYYGHIGLYAFRMETLERFVTLGKSGLENTEKLEQLRLLENGVPIRMVITTHRTVGVDRPDDIEKVEKLLRER